MNREYRRQMREVFKEHATDGWSGDAVALDEAGFLDALDEILVPCNVEWGECLYAGKHRCSLPRGHYGWHMCSNQRAALPPTICLAVQFHKPGGEAEKTG